MNKNATYRKVFEPIETTISNNYLDLPETTISERIRKFRKINGYDRKEFSKICGIGYSSLCRYETGLSIPNNVNLNKINSIINIL